MGVDKSARWALPFLQPGQAQKEMIHNEALALLDALAQAGAVAIGVDVPPSMPSEGECWIVGDSPSGAWAGHTQCLATSTSGGWRFVTPLEGMTVWVSAADLVARYTNGAWQIGDVTAARVMIGGQQVLGSRRSPIADPAAGTVVDAESRTALTAVLMVLRAHGLIEN